MAELTPVTVLTGFLGAGKTTLLNRLLRHPSLARAAVLVNEFGEIGIDHLLVQKLDDTTVLLNAGCICCSVRGDLVNALRTLLPRARRDDITRVIIETTGLADPLPILATLTGDPVAASAYRLDSIVTVIDAPNGLENLAHHQEAARQVAIADRLIISKPDLADPAPLRARLRTLNPAAPIRQAADGAIDPAFILGAGLSPRAPDLAAWLNTPMVAPNVVAPNLDAPDHDHHHHHGAGIDTFSLTFDQPLDWPGLSLWLQTITAAHGARLLRLKGILNLRGQDRPMALHVVRHLVHPLQKLPAWPETDPRTTRLVFITDGLDRRVIEDGLRAFQTAARPEAPSAV